MEAIKRTANLDRPTTELMRFADPESLKRAQGAFGGMGMDAAGEKLSQIAIKQRLTTET